MDIRSIALSGLQAASRRLAVAADNVANVRTSRQVETEGVTPEGVFQPQRVVQVSLEGGGVRAVEKPVDPATYLVPDINSPTGLAEFPNVDLAASLVDARLASISYKANLSILETLDEMEDALFDIKT